MPDIEIFGPIVKLLVYALLACIPLGMFSFFFAWLLDSESLRNLGRFFFYVFGIAMVISMGLFFIFGNGYEEIQNANAIYLTHSSQDDLPIYEQPTSNSTVVGYTERFESVRRQEEGDWTYIETTRGVNGWVRTSDINGPSTERMLETSLEMLVIISREIFSLNMLKDIVIGIVVSAVFIWVFGKVRGEYLDERVSLLVTGVVIAAAVFVDYDFSTLQGMMEGSGVVGQRLFISGLAGFLGASLMEVIVGRSDRKIGCVGVILGVLGFLLFIFYFTWIAYG